MKSNEFKSKLNIGFSFVLMIVMGALIIKDLVAKNKEISGYIEYFECFNNRKDESTYQYNLQLKNGEVFRNLIEVPCEVIPKMSNGDYVKIESVGHIFVQITFNGVELFDRSYLERRKNTTNYIFIFLFLLGLLDFSFRMYVKLKVKNSTSL